MYCFAQILQRVKRVTLLLIIIALSNFISYGQKKNYQISAIAFYNFENLYDTEDDPKKFDEEFTPAGANHYTDEIYRQKLHNLATVLKQLGTDVTPDGPAIIGTAEIENRRVLEDLVAEPEIAARHYGVVHFEGPDSRGIDCAMLYNPKYFKLLSARSLYVNLRSEDGSAGGTRDVLHVTGLLSGDTVHVFVNHWPSRRGGEAASAPRRAKAAAVGRKVIDSLMKDNENAKIILMGDLNDDPIDASVVKVMKAKGDRDDVKKGDMFNPFTKLYKQGIGSLGYNDSWNLFDQIMISGAYLKDNNTGWKYYKAEVFNRDFLKNKFGQWRGYPHRSFDGTIWLNGYSDHFPTLVYIIKEALAK